MPFWRRDPAKQLAEAEIESARREAEAVLGAGWRLEYSDYEPFTVPGGRLETYGILAMGPSDERMLVVGVGEADSYRQLVRHLRGELSSADAWAPPLDVLTGRARKGNFATYREGFPDSSETLREFEGRVPAGWIPFGVDRERYMLRGSQLETFGVAAESTSGEAALAIALTLPEACRALLQRLSGELAVSEGWVPPLGRP